MKLWTTGLTLMAALVIANPAPVSAQRGPQGTRGTQAMRGRQPIEMIMRLRDRLELTDDQIAKLDEIRADVVQRRTAHQAQMQELRSKVMAGEMERSELMKLAEERREASEAVREQTRQRVEAVLTDAQKATLKELQGRARAFQRGRALGARQGRAFRRGGHRFAPGGRGFSPRAGHRGFRALRGAPRRGMMRRPPPDTTLAAPAR